MPDYVQRLKIEPEEWSPYRYQVKDAWLILYIRADYPEEASVAMNDYLDSEGWKVLEVAEYGIADISKAHQSYIVEESLARTGLCAQLDMCPPPLDQGFSKN